MLKFVSYCQWGNEHFKVQNVVILCRQRHYERSTVMATAQWTPPRYWQKCNELLRDIGNMVMNSSAMMPVAMLRPVENILATLQRERGSSVQPLKKPKTKMPPIPSARWIFIPALENCFQIANSCTIWSYSFKGLSQQGGREDFSQNLGTSLFNDDLSNEPNFIRIHLAGQYL